MKRCYAIEWSKTKQTYNPCGNSRNIGGKYYCSFDGDFKNIGYVGKCACIKYPEIKDQQLKLF